MSKKRNQPANLDPLRRVRQPPGAPGGGGAGGSGGGGGGPAVNRPAGAPLGPAPLIGEPELIPQHTFIAVPQPGDPDDNGFINNALANHRAAGLRVHEVGSIEEILELLANTGVTGTGVLDRIRIVTHFFVPGPNEPQQPSNMKIRMVRGGGLGTFKRHFEGFARNSIDGLRALLTFDGTGHLDQLSVVNAALPAILAALRTAGLAAVVDPLFPVGGTPSQDVSDFAAVNVARWMVVREPAIFPATVAADTIRTDLPAAYQALATLLKARLSAPPASLPLAQLNALEAAIQGLATLGLSYFTPPERERERLAANARVGPAAAAGDRFLNKLHLIRPRFDRFTTIDIRGCQAGADRPYMASVQTFFGQSPTVRPVITAPSLFQRYNQISTIAGWDSRPEAAASQINGLHSGGRPPFHSAATVRTRFAAWADAFGIGAAHLTFWQTTFRLGVLEFSKLLWRSAIPPRRVTVGRLDAIPGAGFGAVFDLLADIFLLPHSVRLSAQQIGSLTPLLTHLPAWTTQLDAPIPPASTATDLGNHFDAFKTIYEAVEARMATAGFATSTQRVIPASATGLTVARVRAFQANLKAFIRTNPNSFFAPVAAFLTAADAAARGAPARMRYFLGLGLVFQLHHDTAVDLDAHDIIFLEDSTGPPAGWRQNEAIRHWIRAQWRGIAPPAIPATLTVDEARHCAWIVTLSRLDRMVGPGFVCPERGYSARIVPLPA